jgi:hypothetical protein
MVVDPVARGTALDPSSGSELQVALHCALEELRRDLGDPTAALAVVVPTHANAVLARLTLAQAGPYMGVHFLTPEELVGALAVVRLAQQGLSLEPAAWLEATLEEALPRLRDAGRLGRFGETLCEPGWVGALARALRELDGAGVTAERLGDDALDSAMDSAWSERRALLVPLMRTADEARRAQRLAGARERDAAALAAVEADDALPVQALRGAVVLGDRGLAHGVFVCARAWLARRVGRRLAVDPLERLAPAPLGLRLAAAHLPTLAVPSPAGTQLGRLRAALWDASLPGCGEDDGTVVLAATPDEVREVTEAVRVIQRAIARGVPLDRLAIALPDGATAAVLAGLLERAGIKATWLTGPPLAQTPTAQLLLLALAMAGGDDTVQRWYDLLRQPGLLRRGRLRGRPLVGTGRWRRLLARCGAVRGAPRILAALSAWRSALHPAPPGSPADVAACESLETAIHALSVELRSLPERATLGRHGRAWRDFLRAYLPYSAERAQVERLLEAWGSERLGPELSLHQAARLLTTTLGSAELLRGALTEPAVRVVPPMALLGGELAVVCVLGLNQGRFPRELREDELLPDGLLDELNARFGERLVPSTLVRDAERRRFGAVLCACSGALWLSVPQSEMLSGRPMVAGSLVLDVTTALLGRRAGHRDVKRVLLRAGSRERHAPDRPEDALTPVEHLLARLRADAPEALAGLANHPAARRLMAMYRAIDRFNRPVDGAPRVPDAWTGRLRPDLLPTPVLDGAPERAHVLAEAVREPGRYLFRRLLGAWPPVALPRDADPADAWRLPPDVLRALEAALSRRPDDLEAAFREAWQALRDEAERFVEPQEGRRALAEALAKEALRDYLRHHPVPPPGPLADATDLAVGYGLPWRLKGPMPRFGDGRLVSLIIEKEDSPQHVSLDRDLAVVLQAMALAASGAEVTSVELRPQAAKARTSPLDPLIPRVQDLVDKALQRARHGYWPLGKDAQAFTLGRLQPVSADEADELVRALGVPPGREPEP